MPLFEIGYRRYEGERTPHAMRWWPITRTGLTIAWRSKLLKRLVLASFLPFMYFGWVFFVIGRVTDPSASQGTLAFEVAEALLGSSLVEQLHTDPATVRSAVWAIVFSQFATYVQLLIAGLVAAIAGPSLIANDLKSRAFLIYFARPISPLDYVIGKAGVLVALLASVTLLPSLFLYTLSILFSPSLETITQTFPVAIAIVASTIGAIVPVSLFVLTLSSLTSQSRFATVTWFVACLFGPLTHIILQQTQGLRGNGWTFFVSLPHTVRTFQMGLYDVGGHADKLAASPEVTQVIEGFQPTESPLRAGVWLAIVAILCLFILLRRVDSPTRI